MISFFKKNKQKAGITKLKNLYKKAVSAQRNGKLRQYGEIMTEINKIELELSMTDKTCEQSK